MIKILEMDYKGDPHRFLYRKRDCSMIGESTLFEGESSDNDHQDCNNAQNQLGIYSPADAAFDGIKSRPSQIRAYHIARSVVAFTAQCSVCFKWRFLPSKEKFEEIREHILEQPFVCAVAREWRPKISCNDDPDITQDGSKLWAIERPNTARPPLGWERLLKIRGPGGARFADVYVLFYILFKLLFRSYHPLLRFIIKVELSYTFRYYVTPSGMRLRSKVEVQRYFFF